MTGATQGRSKLQIIVIATFSTFILRQNTDKVTIPQTETVLYTENAGVENAAPDCRGGKRGSGKRRSLKSVESEDFKNVFLTVLTERIVWKQTRTLLLHKGGLLETTS